MQRMFLFLRGTFSNDNFRVAIYSSESALLCISESLFFFDFCLKFFSSVRFVSLCDLYVVSKKKNTKIRLCTTVRFCTFYSINKKKYNKTILEIFLVWV